MPQLCGGQLGRAPEVMPQEAPPNLPGPKVTPHTLSVPSPRDFPFPPPQHRFRMKAEFPTRVTPLVTSRRPQGAESQSKGTQRGSFYPLSPLFPLPLLFLFLFCHFLMIRVMTVTFFINSLTWNFLIQLGDQGGKGKIQSNNSCFFLFLFSASST